MNETYTLSARRLTELRAQAAEAWAGVRLAIAQQVAPAVNAREGKVSVYNKKPERTSAHQLAQDINLSEYTDAQMIEAGVPLKMISAARRADDELAAHRAEHAALTERLRPREAKPEPPPLRSDEEVRAAVARQIDAWAERLNKDVQADLQRLRLGQAVEIAGGMGPWLLAVLGRERLEEFFNDHY